MFRTELSFPKEVSFVVSTLVASGYEAYPVGGCIRDALLGRPVYDYDITTDALPEIIIQLFDKTIPTGIKHGTVTVLVNNIPIEVTTFRVDGNYTDGRKPDSVSFTKSLKEDIKRRDFTINALAYDIPNNRLIDEVGAIADLEKKVIRTIGKAEERFQEDKLRMMRAVRFVSQLGFSLDDQTMTAIATSSHEILSISTERIKDELVKLFGGNDAIVGLEWMRKLNLMKHILPEVIEMVGVSQNTFHQYDVYEHCLETLKQIDTKKPLLRMVAFFHDIGKPQCKKMLEGKDDPVFYDHENVGAIIMQQRLRAMKFSNDDIQYITHLIRCHMLHYTPQWTDGAIRRFINKVGEDYIEDWFLLRYADRLATGQKEACDDELIEFKQRISQILKEKTALKISDLAIDGNRLMTDLDLKPSKKVGDILQKLLEEVLENPSLNTYEQLVTMARKFL